jgi:hypothetical protein
VTDAVDLSRFDALVSAQEKGLDVAIKSPDGKPVGLTIKVAGPDSQRYRSALQSIQDAQLQAEDYAETTSAELEQRSLLILAKCTIDWSPNPKFDGQERPCTEAAAIDLYRRYPFIRDQVAARAGRRASFTKGSASASAGPSGAVAATNARQSQA